MDVLLTTLYNWLREMEVDMSYSKGDHPPRVGVCRYCGEKFETMGRYTDVCSPCFAELNDEWPEDGQEGEEDEGTK